jgi:hypothetical protein
MTDHELRAMIRDAIARHAGAGTVRLKPDTTGIGETGFVETGIGPSGVHASHARLLLLRSGDDDGRCLIEPAVRCNHCGYCLSFGH